MEDGARIVKNVLIDLGVRRNGDLEEIFEVKTSASRSDVYAGIGQLMVHGHRADCRRMLVLPDDEPLASDVQRALARLRIDLLTYSLNDEKVRKRRSGGPGIIFSHLGKVEEAEA